jgi:hypothetical protein
MQQHARELLSSALLQTNCPPVFLENQSFKQYIRFISGERYFAPSRYVHMETVNALAAQCHDKIHSLLKNTVSFSIEEDAWTGDGRKFSAITAGVIFLHSMYKMQVSSVTR